jgi:glycerophosphoryl diester phosphodiesterase
MENTVESCLEAARVGAHMVEVDAQLTSDGELIVFHDWGLRRLARVAGAVEGLASRQVIGLSLRHHRRGGLLTGSIPSLRALLAALPSKLPVNLELKRRLASPQALIEALAEHVGERKRLLVSSFDWRLLGLAREAFPELPLAPIADRDPDALAAAGQELSAFSLHCHTRIAGSLLALEPAHPVLVYTVNRLAAARRWLDLGASGVFTDHPGPLSNGLLEPVSS